MIKRVLKEAAILLVYAASLFCGAALILSIYAKESGMPSPWEWLFG